MDICPETVYRETMRRQRTRTHSVCNTKDNDGLCSATATDRRVQKTQKVLREALASLIAEKSYDAIVIKEILERANVGRSTFYTHFRDKDDLLVSSIHGMVESVQSAKLRRSGIWYERVLWFSLPIFEYHYGHRHNGQLTIDGVGRALQHRRLQQVLGDIITDAVRTEFTSPRKYAKAASPDLIVQYISSTFVLVLEWWLDTKHPVPPKTIDEVFHSLVLPTLSSIRA